MSARVLIALGAAVCLIGCPRDRAGISQLDAKISLAPDDVDLLLERAHLYIIAHKADLALADAERAMKLDPASVRARIQAGEALLDLGRAKEAAALHVSGELARGQDRHVPLAVLRELGEEDRQALTNPDDPAPLVARAKTLRGLRQFPLALADIGAALALDDEYAPAHAEAAESLDQSGRKTEAAAERKCAAELNQSPR